MALTIEVVRFLVLEEGGMIYFIMGGISASSVYTLLALLYISPYFGGKETLALTSIAGLCVGTLVIHIFINRLEIAFPIYVAWFIVFVSLFLGSFFGARLIAPKLYDQIGYTLAIVLIFVIGLAVSFGIGYILYIIGIPKPISSMLGLVFGTILTLIYGSQKLIESHKILGLSSVSKNEVYCPIGAGFTVASIIIFLGVGLRWLSDTINEVMNITIVYQWIILYELIVIATGFTLGYVVGYQSQIITEDVRS